MIKSNPFSPKQKSILLLDYDGTLTPIVDFPENAKISNKRRDLLKKISQKVPIAIVSGRDIKSLKKFLKLPNIYYVGNHGFEIEYMGKKTINPAAKKFAPTLAKLTRALNKALKSFAGCRIENKKWSGSAHFRGIKPTQVKKFKKIFWQTVKPFTKVKITEGKKVFELRPPVNWHKGKAVKWLLKKFKGYQAIYIGDDTTDEDAFKVVKNSCRVGRTKKTAAKHFLKDVDEVYQFMLNLEQ